jgi:N-acetylneuraminate synthase/N,N'-diacetyllegionaminate synthase
MKIGVAILARMSSFRFPGKALHLIGDRPLLERVISRALLAGLPVAVCTSADRSDDAIADLARRRGVGCFRGSLDDVAARLLTCAQSAGWDFVLRINGDNVFTDPSLVSTVAHICRTDCFDLVSNVPGRTFPFGVSVEGLRTSFLENHISSFDEADREHVTRWFYERPEVGRRFSVLNESIPSAAGLNLAVDRREDADRAARLIERAGALGIAYQRLSLADVVRLAKTTDGSNTWSGKHGPMLVAEIGGNHEGDFGKARHLCELAIDSGADAVKFQIYSGDRLVSPVESPDRNRHFKQFELPLERHIELATMCRSAGVTYSASIWDEESLLAMNPYLSFFKIGSGDLTASTLLETHARLGKPILLSTGLATFDEVVQAVSGIQRVDSRYGDPDHLCVLQCTSMYPIPATEAHLRVMSSLRRELGVSVGYSDHTVGARALRTAAAMGADVLEFHFTDSRDGKTFRDHAVSLTRSEVRELAEQLAEDRVAFGDMWKIPSPSELDARHPTSFRRAVYTRRPMRAGEVLHEEDLVILRPLHGTDARDWDLVVGATVRRDIEAYTAIHRDDDFVPAARDGSS